MGLSNKERLYADLKRRILTMELEPASDLDGTRLSQSYGISRTPLRNVFRQLSGEGNLALRAATLGWKEWRAGRER